MVVLRQDIEYPGRPPGFEGCDMHPFPVPSDGFSFDFPLPSESTYSGRGFVSMRTASLNRSASNDRSMSPKVAGGVSGVAFPRTSKRLHSNHGGPPVT